VGPRSRGVDFRADQGTRSRHAEGHGPHHGGAETTFRRPDGLRQGRRPGEEASRRIVSQMAACPVRGVRAIELVAANLDEAARFYETVWNLTPVDVAPAASSSGNKAPRYFRGTARYHHVLALHAGAQPAVMRVVFDVADRTSIDALHEKIAAAGAKPSKPAKITSAGGGYGFACKDPDGRNLAFVCDVA